MHRYLKSLLVLTVLPFALSHCAQKRDPEFADGESPQIYQKSELENATLSVTTSSEWTAKSANAVSAVDGGGFSVAKVEGPERLKSIFLRFPFRGKAGTTYTVRLQLDSHFLTVLKVQPENEKLSLAEESFVEPGSRLVPLFAFPVDDFGTVVHAKTVHGEETSQLRLEASEWKSSTHVRLRLVPDFRVPVDLAAQESARKDRIFSRESLDHKRMTVAELRRDFGISVDADPSKAYYLKLQGSRLGLYEMISDGGERNEPYEKCPEGPANCWLLVKYWIPFRGVELKRSLSPGGTALSPTLEVRAARQGASSKLIEMALLPEPQRVDQAELEKDSDPRHALRVGDFKGKSFLLMRTLIDMSTEFEFLFTGLSGGMKLVEFEFEDTRIVVRAKHPMLRAVRGSSRVDLEEFLSLPARYKKPRWTDEQGNPLSSPQYIAAKPDDEGAVAYVDWTQTSIGYGASPLIQYGFTECFEAGGANTVTDVVRKPSDGTFGFTMNSTYRIRTECSSAHFYGTQSLHTFQERVSFKPYTENRARYSPPKIPIAAQKQLGFGYFTDERPVLDEYQSFLDGTRVESLIETHDIRDGKAIVYHLKGLPDDQPALKAKLIEATRVVINDWNRAFERAFQGTPLGHRGPVLELVVDDESDPHTAKIGELGFNSIVWDGKRRNSGFLGFGSIEPNPDTGFIESSTIFMYGGTIRNILAYMKRESEAYGAYDARLEKGAPADAPAATPAKPKVAGTWKAPGLGGLDSLMAKAAEQFSSRLGEESARKAFQRDSVDPANSLVRSEMTSGLDLVSIVKQAAKNGALYDRERLEGVVADELLRSSSGKLTPEGRESMEHEVRFKKMSAKILSHLQASRTCLFDAHDASVALEGAKKFRELPADELLVRFYTSILAHELGHSLGLRHNFIASYDKANWKFLDREDTKRQYSSVMDYLDDVFSPYDGIGPQDVFALRAGYAGLIELSSKSLEKAEARDGTTTIASVAGPAKSFPLVSKRFIKLEDYREALGLESWYRLNFTKIRPLTPRLYAYCADEDVPFSALCARSDRGTTPLEIVENRIKRYQALYPLHNLAEDRVHYSWWDRGAYVVHLLQTFGGIHAFLDEMVAHAVDGRKGKAISDYMPAVIKGSEFFQAVVRTPDAPVSLANSPEERFIWVDGPDHKKALIERKWAEDVLAEGSETRLVARGVDIDKGLALLFLTLRDADSSPASERTQISRSYADFERMVMPEGMPASESQIVGLLKEILLGAVQPGVLANDGVLVFDSAFPLLHVSETQWMTMYSLLGATINIESTNVKDENENFTRLFSVHSGKKAPAGVPVLTAPRIDPSDPDALKYWVPPSAVDALEVFTNARYLLAIRKHAGELDELIYKWVDEGMPEKAASLSSALLKILLEIQPETGIDRKTFCAGCKIEEGLSFLNNLSKQLPLLARTKDSSSQSAFKKQAETLGQAFDASESVAHFNLALRRSLGLALLKHPQYSDINSEVLFTIAPTNDEVAIRYGILFKKLEIMNEIFYGRDPRQAKGRNE